MKALIQLSDKQCKNRELALMDEPLFFKICGKMQIDYYFDFLYQLGIKEVYIASPVNQEIHSRLSEMNPLNLDITFLEGDTSQSTYVNFYELFYRDDLLIIDGSGFIMNDIYSIKEELLSHRYNCMFSNDDFRVIWIKQHSLNHEFDLFDKQFDVEVKAIVTLKDYLFVTDSILKVLTQKYILPGYGDENGIIMGKNVEIEEGCKLIAPLIILDNVKVCKNTLLGPNTILSKNVFVQANCEVTNTIVYDNTVLGGSLKLDNKLILSNNIVDKNNKKVYNIDTKFASTNAMSLFTF